MLVADTTSAARALNERTRAERILTGDLLPGREVALTDGIQASVGDLVITRCNDRRLRTWRNGWVRNGERWTVTDVRDDGSVVVRRQDRKHGGSVVLPAAYVAEHVDLGYAVTAHRAQGITVDSAHVVVTDTTPRENLYVAMTRGCDTNVAYVEFVGSLNAEGINGVRAYEVATPAGDPLTQGSPATRLPRRPSSEPCSHWLQAPTGSRSHGRGSDLASGGPSTRVLRTTKETR